MDNPEQNPDSQELLAQGLRRLARSSPRGASPELERALLQAFRRRHQRRRTLRFAFAMAVCLAIVSAISWWRLATGNPSGRLASNHRMNQQISSGAAPGSRSLSNADGATFVALPSFALSRPDEELRIMSVEMPASTLRLLGARVNEELSTQKIVADVLVGADGTPYAFRIIS